MLGKSHGQRNLAGYSPWGRTESDTTEHIGKQAILLLILKKKKKFRRTLLKKKKQFRN